MSVTHYSLTIFVALNVARAIAYWPQIVSIYRDPGSAGAVSLWTWIVFTAANVATVVYAVAGIEDFIVAAVFGVNAVGCAAIVMLTAYKRCHRLPLVRKRICAGVLRERGGRWAQPDCLAPAPAKALAVALRPIARWRAARSATRRRYVQDIAKKGLAAID